MKNLLIILTLISGAACTSAYKNAYKLSYQEKNSNNYLAEQAHETVKKNVRKKEVRARIAHRNQMKLEKRLHEMNDASINRANPHQKRAKRPNPFY
jgi:ribosomal protein S13